MCSTPRMSLAGGIIGRRARSTRLAMFLARSPIRSRSLAMRIAATISRRSTAIGWRRAMIRTACSSISRCSASIVACRRRSRAAARSTSRLIKRVDARRDLLSASPPISAILPRELLQLVVEGLDGMLGHGHVSVARPAVSRSGR